MTAEKVPLVSVVIPVYNDERYVGDCVKSVLAGTYPQQEVIVVDDGSTDDTPTILGSFADRIHYVRQENRGPAAALNEGIRASSGVYVAWLSSDDLFYPNKIGLQVRLLLREPRASLVYTDYTMIDGRGRVLRTVCCEAPCPTAALTRMLRGNYVNGSTVLMRRACFSEVGGFDETLRAAVDTDMWFRLLKAGMEFRHISEPLVWYRWHRKNLSHNYRLMRESKDTVRVRVVKSFSPEELFGPVLGSGGRGLKSEYELLAWLLAKQLNTRAARAALAKARQQGPLSRRGAALALVLRAIDNRAFYAAVSMLRKQRRLLLDLLRL